MREPAELCCRVDRDAADDVRPLEQAGQGDALFPHRERRPPRSVPAASGDVGDQVVGTELAQPLGRVLVLQAPVGVVPGPAGVRRANGARLVGPVSVDGVGPQRQVAGSGVVGDDSDLHRVFHSRGGLGAWTAWTPWTLGASGYRSAVGTAQQCIIKCNLARWRAFWAPVAARSRRADRRFRSRTRVKGEVATPGGSWLSSTRSGLSARSFVNDAAPVFWFQPSSPRVASARLLTFQDAWQQTTVRVPSLSSMSTDWWPGVYGQGWR